MKKLQYILLVLVLVLASCNNKDSIWNVMGDMDSRVSTLETLCQEMNTNIAALETLIKAQNNGDYITNVTEIRNGNTIVGYTITFNHHDPITIYNGTNGKDGRDGVDGYKPTVGAKQDTDGVYYWTVDGNWLTDANGNKIRVTGEKGEKGDKGDTGDKGQDGQDGTDGTDGTNGVNGNTPQLKIENNYWYISYDGTNWTQLGKATGADGKDGQDGTNGDKGDKGDKGDSMFSSVTQDDNYVYFTLADGTIIKIAKNGSSGSGTGNQPNSEFMFEVTYDANGGVGTMSKDIFYYGVSKQLTYCKFIRTGYAFRGWNTQRDGTGIGYADMCTIMIGKNITLYAQWEVRKYSGEFSVSKTSKIVFSTGNLQYHPHNKIWRFAEHQYDYINDGHLHTDSTYNDWIDTFYWGTDGTPTSPRYFVDWGVNVIEDCAPNTWRTLSFTEWSYVVNRKDTAGLQLAISAMIDGNYGVLLLPDNWKDIPEISPNRDPNSRNFYNLDDWSILEAYGAVFLPAINGRGYWSSTASSYSGFVYFFTCKLKYDDTGHYIMGVQFYADVSHYAQTYSDRLAVRLVQDVK